MQSRMRHFTAEASASGRPGGLWGILALWGLLGALIFSPVQGAVIPMTIEEILAHSDDVVVGRIGPEQEVMTTAGSIYTRYTFLVEESLMGTRQVGEEITLMMPGGEIGGIGMRAIGLPMLRPEEDLILFLDRPSHERLAYASQATGMPEDHPVLTSPRIVGGPQGKFTLVRHREGTTDPVSGMEPGREVTRVMREVPGRRLANQQYPTLDEFRTAIKRLASDEVPTRIRVRSLPGEAPVDIPERDPDAKALRAFDPFSPPAGLKREVIGPLQRESLETGSPAEEDSKTAGPQSP